MSYINKNTTYALVDEDGKIIEKFRLGMTARVWKPILEDELDKKLKVKYFGDDGPETVVTK